MLLAAAFAAIAIGARADQIIAGTALTLGAVGLTGTVYRQAYGTGGAGLALPTLGPVPIPVWRICRWWGRRCSISRFRPTSL